MTDQVPSDIVEVILAVDLNPSDPEEPINVKDVKVNPGGDEDTGESCHMCQRILDALTKIDPDLEAAVDGKPVQEAVRALEDMAEGAPEEAQEEADMFDKAMDAQSEPEKPRRPEKPASRGEGGFRKAAENAFGKKRDEAPPFGKKRDEDEDEE